MSSKNGNKLCDDFTKAEYGTVKEGVFLVPTAKNSKSGTIFITIGSIIGFIIGALIFRAFFEESNFKTGGRFLWFVGGISIGGFIGAALHSMIGAGLRAVRNPQEISEKLRQSPYIPPSIPSYAVPPSPEQDIKWACPYCGQHIEAPVSFIGTTVACPTCQEQIVLELPSSTPQETESPPQPIPTPTLPPLIPQRSTQPSPIPQIY